jgi:hypothetical protein
MGVAAGDQPAGEPGILAEPFADVTAGGAAPVAVEPDIEPAAAQRHTGDPFVRIEQPAREIGAGAGHAHRDVERGAYRDFQPRHRFEAFELAGGDAAERLQQDRIALKIGQHVA